MTMIVVFSSNVNDLKVFSIRNLNRFEWEKSGGKRKELRTLMWTVDNWSFPFLYLSFFFKILKKRYTYPWLSFGSRRSDSRVEAEIPSTTIFKIKKKGKVWKSKIKKKIQIKYIFFGTPWRRFPNEKYYSNKYKTFSRQIVTPIYSQKSRSSPSF